MTPEAEKELKAMALGWSYQFKELPLRFYDEMSGNQEKLELGVHKIITEAYQTGFLARNRMLRG